MIAAVADTTARALPASSIERASAKAAMNLSERFIRRPVMTILVMIAILLFGIIAYERLPISDLPTVDYPTITRERESAGREPGDDGVGRRDAAREAVLDDRRHRQHDVDVEPGIDVDHAAVLAQPRHRRRGAGRPGRHRADAAPACRSASRRRRIRRRIPPRRRFSSSRSRRRPCRSRALDEVGETLIGQRLSMIDGVAQVQVFGAAKYAVRVQLDPTALAYRQIGIDEVATAINAPERQSADRRALGSDDGVHASGERPAGGRRRVPRDDRHLPQRRRGARSASLGRVLDDVQNNKSASWFNGTRAIVLAVQRQPNTNTVAVAKAVNAELDSLRAQIPGGVSVQHAVRPVARHRAVGARREADAAPHARAGGRRDLPVPAQRSGRRSFRASRCRCRWSARSR